MSLVTKSNNILEVHSISTWKQAFFPPVYPGIAVKSGLTAGVWEVRIVGFMNAEATPSTRPEMHWRNGNTFIHTEFMQQPDTAIDLPMKYSFIFRYTGSSDINCYASHLNMLERCFITMIRISD